MNKEQSKEFLTKSAKGDDMTEIWVEIDRKLAELQHQAQIKVAVARHWPPMAEPMAESDQKLF